MSELLPINPSLYDPALQYSDQYMDLAMVPPIVNQIKQNSDDIEELKEGGGGGGGAKFGPYFLCNGTNKTITAGSSPNVIALTQAVDGEGNPCVLPMDDKTHYFEAIDVGPMGYSLVISSFCVEYNYNYELVPTIALINISDSSITLESGTPLMRVMSDVEFAKIEDA